MPKRVYMEKILQPFRSNASLTSSSEARHDQAMTIDKHSPHNLGVSVHCYSTLEECHSHQNIAPNVAWTTTSVILMKTRY